MNIKKFREGDIITRIKPCLYDCREKGSKKIKDGSYMGERIIFLGHDEKTKIIFFRPPFQFLTSNKNIATLSYGRDRWDEGWEYYPEKLWQHIKK